VVYITLDLLYLAIVKQEVSVLELDN